LLKRVKIGGNMTNEEQILETIQQIGGIFLTKNIAAVPVNLDYLEEKVAPGMEKLVVMELIMYLEDLFIEYKEDKQRDHRFSRYIEIFKGKLGDNSDGGNLVGRSKRSA